MHVGYLRVDMQFSNVYPLGKLIGIILNRLAHNDNKNSTNSNYYYYYYYNVLKGFIFFLCK